MTFEKIIVKRKDFEIQKGMNAMWHLK